METLLMMILSPIAAIACLLTIVIIGCAFIVVFGAIIEILEALRK